jgi:hypothetical protein
VGCAGVHLPKVNQFTFMSIKEDIMITINPDSKERTDIEEIIIIDLMTLIFTPIFTPETI